MTINKAVNLAMMMGGRIKRMDDPCGCEFEPTNTDDCIIIHGPDGAKPSIRWNPSADDLTSDCWVVVVRDQDGKPAIFFGRY